MKDALYQFVGGIAGVLLVYASGLIYRAALGFDPPLGEVAIITIGTIAGARTVVAGYSDMQVRRAVLQYGPPPQP